MEITFLYVDSRPIIKIKFEGEDIVQEIVKAVLLIELAGTCKDWLS